MDAPGGGREVDGGRGRPFESEARLVGGGSEKASESLGKGLSADVVAMLEVCSVFSRCVCLGSRL